MFFNLIEVPFSRYGSYLAFSQRPDGVYLRTVHGAVPRSEICRIEMLHGDHNNNCEVSATPSVLRIESAIGSIEICFADTKIIRLRGTGVGIRLRFAPELYDCAVARAEGWQINSFSNRINLALVRISGVLTVDAPWRDQRAEHLLVDCLPDASGGCENKPALAWDQLMLLFDRRDEFGALPDAINDQLSVWNFCKPPIHGWALLWMLRRSDFISSKQLPHSAIGPIGGCASALMPTACRNICTATIRVGIIAARSMSACH